MQEENKSDNDEREDEEEEEEREEEESEVTEGEQDYNQEDHIDNFKRDEDGNYIGKDGRIYHNIMIEINDEMIK
jgi:hypothetical protein